MARDKELDLVEDDEDFSDEEELEALVEAEGASGLIGFIGGLLLGTLIGAGVALLVAPERGDVTRRRIRTKVRDVTGDAREQFEDLRDGAERELRRRRRKIRRRLNRGAS
jgi:uncharacterized membrane protein YccC